MKTYIVIKEGVIIGGKPLGIGAEFQADAHSIPAFLRFGSVAEKPDKADKADKADKGKGGDK